MGMGVQWAGKGELPSIGGYALPLACSPQSPSHSLARVGAQEVCAFYLTGAQNVFVE